MKKTTFDIIGIIASICLIMVSAKAAAIVAWHDESLILFMLLWILPTLVAGFTIIKALDDFDLINGQEEA